MGSWLKKSMSQQPPSRMTDYAEERASELEVLQSIYPDELEVISDDVIAVQVTPEEQNEENPYVLKLVVTYGPTYPDETPELDLEIEEGDVTDDERLDLLRRLGEAANESVGMAMVYTLTMHLKDSLVVVLDERKKREAAADEERYRLEEEALAKKTQGTKVTKESFLAWRDKFEKERAAQIKKEQEDWLKALAGKEREEARKFLSKPTGRQLFERDASLVTSDAQFEEEGDVAVDLRQYERREAIDEDEEEEEEIRPPIDSDSD